MVRLRPGWRPARPRRWPVRQGQWPLRRPARLGGGRLGQVEGGPGVGRPDGGVGAGCFGIDGWAGVVFQVGQRRVIGMDGQPGVDQALGGARPAEGAPDEVAAPLGFEVGERLGITGVAPSGGSDLGLDRRVVDRDPLGIGNLGQDEQGLDPVLGPGPELGVEIGFGLLGRLEVGRLADALPGDRRPELVVHHLDLLVDQDRGHLEGGIGDGVLDDPVAEGVAGPVQGVPLEPLLDAQAQLGHVRELAHLGRELVVDRGHDLLAQLLDIDREVGLLAGQAGLAVVGREVDVELEVVAHPAAHDVGLEARDQALLAQDDRHPVRRATFEGHPVAGPDEADHGVVAVGRRPVLERAQGAVLVAQLGDHLVDLGLVDGVDLGREVEVAVVAQGDLGRHLDGRLEDQGLALDGLDHLDAGLGQRHDPLLDERLAVGLLDRQLDRLVQDGRLTQHPLEHEARRLARPESGDPGPSGEPSGGLVHRPREVLGRQLDLEQDRRVGSGRGSDIHRRGV